MIAKHDDCPHCGNRVGFAFGTCIECGWNYLTRKFHWIKVWTENDPMPKHLVQEHATRTRDSLRKVYGQLEQTVVEHSTAASQSDQNSPPNFDHEIVP